MDEDDQVLQRINLVWDDTVDTLFGSFEIWSTDNVKPPVQSTRSKPVTRLTNNEQEIKLAIYNGGLCSSIRRVGYKYLLGLYHWSDSVGDRTSGDQGSDSYRTSQYQTLKRKWKDTLRNAPSSHPIHDSLQRIEKDVVRTDRSVYIGQDYSTNKETIHHNEQLTKLFNILMSYCFYTQEEFVQGMADIASLFLITMEHEADAFWTFVQFMKQYKSNFSKDGSGMKRQLDLLRSLIKVMDPTLYSKLKSIDSLHLFCVYRWLLVLFRREFTIEDCQVLWDTILTNCVTNDFQLFVALGILSTYRNGIINQVQSGDELLKFIHNLAMKIQVDEILIYAQDLVVQLRRMGQKRGIETMDGMQVPIERILSRLLNDV